MTAQRQMRFRAAVSILSTAFAAALCAALALAAGCDPASPPPAWAECRLSSNWRGPNARERMMNVLSPAFPDAKAREYVEWQLSQGCDHVHVLLVNQGDGEGCGYDALADAGDKELALRRVEGIRRAGLGVVAWVVADESDAARRRVFERADEYAASLADFLPHVSYVVLGLEMDEGEGSRAQWARLADAVRRAGWTGPLATHHASHPPRYAALGEIVMDQLDPRCSAADVEASVRSLRARGLEVCGFEYSRGPDRAKAEAALAAGAFGVGNWAAADGEKPSARRHGR